MGIDWNERLNKQPHHVDKVCVYCGRKYPETVLNIEGRIHHNCETRCLDVKECNKAKKKLKK